MTTTDHDGLTRVAEDLEDARMHEAVLVSDLLEHRQFIQALVDEQRRVALDGVKWTPLEAEQPPPRPGLVHTRRERAAAALLVATSAAIWGVLGVLIALLLRVS